jgi:hypothetical protein
MNAITTRLADTINEFVELHSKRVDWTFQPVQGKWSPKEILGHLIDSAYNNLQQFVRCTYESGFTLVYAQDKWVAAQNYRDADINELLSLWQLINNYPPDRWQAVCNDYTVEFLANDYNQHMSHHSGQIMELFKID